MWLYKESFDINDYFGFVYTITNKKTNKKYVGKKFFFHNKKQKIGKKELALMEGRGRKPKFKTVTKESDWKDYYGSHKDLLKEVDKLGKDNFEREIIKLCKNKKDLTYFETKYQFIFEVLEKPDEYYNDNILGKFFTRDLAPQS